MSGIVAENGVLVTDAMIDGWEDALERDEWPSGWKNVGEVMEGRLPTALNDAVTLSVKIPASMRRAIDAEAKIEGKSTSAYVRGVLADSLMSIA